MILIKFYFFVGIECESSSQLPRCVSDPLQEISSDLSSKSSDKRLSG